MKKINLIICDDAYQSMKNSASFAKPGYLEVAVTKDLEEPTLSKSWTLTLLPREVVEKMKSDGNEFGGSGYVDANGKVVFVYPFNKVNELENKVLEWGDEFIELREKN